MGDDPALGPAGKPATGNGDAPAEPASGGRPFAGLPDGTANSPDATASAPDAPAGAAPDDDGLTGAGEPSVAASVFQVLGADNIVVGAGFLSGGDTGFTCAHVVLAAGRTPGSRVELAFPHLPGAPRVAAEVVTAEWRPPDAEDIAGLRLETVPPGAHGMAAGAGAGCRGHRVFSFGFPAQAPPGGHFAYGEAGDLLPVADRAGQLLQLTAAGDLTTGFSGGPVVDEVTGLVIGMVTAIVSPDAHLKGLGIAYATPAEVLRAVRPGLAEHQPCPYLGLEPFTARHAEWFHGRDAAVERVLTALGGNRRLLMLLGPSGAGKSSLVNAGVLPALAEGTIPGGDRWLPVCVRPGQDLLAQLERGGLPGATSDGLPSAIAARLAAEPGHDRLLLVVDQFEELLTRSGPAVLPRTDDPRLRAVDRLVELSASHAPVTVLLVMRNDFYAPLDALAPELMAAALPGLCNVPATLGRAELKAIVTRPAAAVGLPLEAGLADRIADDVLESDDPAGRQAPVTLLPALELALRQLWLRRRREDGRLTHAAYERIGKVTGSLTVWCDHALGRLPDDQRPTARRVLTALVRPADETDGTPATRRPVPLSRLRTLAAGPRLTDPGTGPDGTDADAGVHADTDADAAFDSVLATLTRHRIVTTSTTAPPGALPGTPPGEPAAELVHDALIRDWADLRGWVAQDHQFQVWLLRATEQQARYAHSGLPGDLLDGSLLAEGEEWAGSRPLPAELVSLLDASRRHQAAALRRTRRLNAVLATMLALALIATGLALYLRHTATTAQHHAVTAQHTAQSRQLAALSAGLTSSNPDVASLLAVKAWRTSRTDEAAGALYTAPALFLQHRLAPTTFTWSVAFSPDCGTLASGGENDGTVRLWDARTGAPRAALTGHTDTVMAVAYSPDGATLATAGADDTVRLWDTHSGMTRAVLANRSDGVESLTFSPDGTTLATGGGNGIVRLWDVTTGKARATLTGGSGIVRSLAFSRDGATLATGSDDGGRLWDVKAGKPRIALAGRDVTVDSVRFGPDGTTLAARIGQSVRLLDAGSGKVRSTVIADTGRMSGLAFSPDGTLLATGGDNERSVRLWDVRTGKTRATLAGHTDLVRSVAFAPDGTALASVGSDGIRLWDTKPVTPRASFADGGEGVSSVAFSPDGGTLAAGRGDGAIRLWDARSGRPRAALAADGQGVSAVAFGPDSRVLAAGSENGDVRLWDVGTGTSRAVLGAPKSASSLVRSLAFSPDGATLATRSDEGTVRLWNVRTGKIRTALSGPTDPVESVAFSPDGGTLATASDEGDVRLWDMSTDKPRKTLPGRKRLAFVAFSRDATTLVIGGKDGTIRLWDLKTGAARTTLTGDGKYPLSIVADPGGGLLATGIDDGTARLWDVRTGRLRATFIGHTKAVQSAAFSPDGAVLATGGEDGAVRLWGADLPGAQAIADSLCAGLRRDFTEAEKAEYLRGQDSEPVC
ncbi:trypsin-like peptidase domain-containing protein [Streptomyces sp. UNOC14_S4]|uniref:nSTAND1 domain-containing NTPase n=1 Tax=Streptomyces sp. UNOC14_S4 TaxID=2872340 RepID=UPI001E48BDF6|nr:trypsin-like peptidase domain-containing protein [Streptomyces sp. UNOC14_S4]MCC3767358.1 trypsin-like peptidase domain-containing protein [Streptomyces sp. UNOC14_S4]